MGINRFLKLMQYFDVYMLVLLINHVASNIFKNSPVPDLVEGNVFHLNASLL